MSKFLSITKLFAVTIISAALTACVAEGSPEPFGQGKSSPGMTPEQAMAGASEQVQAMYKDSCLSCHANNLEGRVGPNTNLQQVGARTSKEAIIKQINTGGKGMPGFQGKLKPEEVEALADWLTQKK